MRWLISYGVVLTCVVGPAACGSEQPSVGRDAGGVDAALPVLAMPRLISPLSMTTVTQQAPRLHWELGAAEGTPVVDLCQDRACTKPLAIAAPLAGDQRSAVPEAALPPGWVFWRVRMVSGERTVASATWQFWVGKASASNPVDTGNGVILDVNGDGYADLLVGADNTNTAAGAAHVYLGSATASVSDWNGAASKRIDLPQPGGESGFGNAVASAGAVNGDGYADFLVAAFATESALGTVHLFLGSPSPSATAWNASRTSARIDLTSPLGTSVAYFGASVAGLGDVDGDGYADFLIRAPTVTDAGVAYVYLGSATPTALTWNGTSAMQRIDLIRPDGQRECFASSVASGGDINGDGYADFFVGDICIPPGGGVHLYLGSRTVSAAVWNAVTSPQRIEVTDPGDMFGAFGSYVSSAGDVNNDGYADFLVGAPASTSPAGEGAAHLYLGSATVSAAAWNGASAAQRIDLANPDGAGAYFGEVVNAGDTNGDGYGDFLVGASGHSQAKGAAHLYLGSATVSATAWNGASPARRIDLEAPDLMSGAFGQTVASAGDVNGDGYPDFIVGAPFTQFSVGAAHVYFGSETISAAAWNGAMATRRLDLVSPDGERAAFGTAVASADQVGDQRRRRYHARLLHLRAPARLRSQGRAQLPHGLRRDGDAARR